MAERGIWHLNAVAEVQDIVLHAVLKIAMVGV
jgi:hypothetical protein